MAEILCELILQQDPLPFFEKIIIKSGAVIYSWTGSMDDQAEEVLRRFYKVPQARLNQFNSCHINRDPSRCQDADLIITMEDYHKHHIPEMFRSKTFTLCELAINTVRDVDDPYGGNLSTYKATAEEIYDYLQLFLAKIRRFF
jgi:protein-tyrosine-phosphatase